MQENNTVWIFVRKKILFFVVNFRNFRLEMKDYFIHGLHLFVHSISASFFWKVFSSSLAMDQKIIQLCKIAASLWPIFITILALSTAMKRLNSINPLWQKIVGNFHHPIERKHPSIHYWSLQPFGQNYDLASHITYVVCINFVH